MCRFICKIVRSLLDCYRATDPGGMAASWASTELIICRFLRPVCSGISSLEMLSWSPQTIWLILAFFSIWGLSRYYCSDRVSIWFNEITYIGTVIRCRWSNLTCFSLIPDWSSWPMMIEIYYFLRFSSNTLDWPFLGFWWTWLPKFGWSNVLHFI